MGVEQNLQTIALDLNQNESLKARVKRNSLDLLIPVKQGTSFNGEFPLDLAILSQLGYVGIEQELFTEHAGCDEESFQKLRELLNLSCKGSRVYGEIGHTKVYCEARNEYVHLNYKPRLH